MWADITSRDYVNKKSDGDKWSRVEKHLKENANSHAPITIGLVVRDFVGSEKRFFVTFYMNGFI